MTGAGRDEEEEDDEEEDDKEDAAKIFASISWMEFICCDCCLRVILNES